jgi:hypothetical protein
MSQNTIIPSQLSANSEAPDWESVYRSWVERIVHPGMFQETSKTNLGVRVDS